VIGLIENNKKMQANIFFSQTRSLAYFWRAQCKEQIVPYLYFYVPGKIDPPSKTLVCTGVNFINILCAYFLYDER